MVRNTVAVLGLALLAGCSGSSLGPDGGGGNGGGTTPPPGAVTVPEALAQNLRAATYDARRQTLTVDLRSLDTGDRVRGAYRRDASRDVAGYTGFSAQENSSQRVFTGLFRRSPDGSLTAGVVGDGGQFRNYFSGGTYRRSGTFTMPARGLASYAGTYAGLLNGGPAVPGPGPGFDPQQALRTRGNVLINADFGNMTVNGGIRNRRIVETGAALSNQEFEATDIRANGTFGDVMGPNAQEESGQYAGVFGGRNAAAVAGIARFNPVQGNDDIIETGVFVLPKCAGGSPSPCP